MHEDILPHSSRGQYTHGQQQSRRRRRLGSGVGGASCDGGTVRMCPHCGRTFKRTEHLERHVRTRELHIRSCDGCGLVWTALADAHPLQILRRSLSCVNVVPRSLAGTCLLATSESVRTTMIRPPTGRRLRTRVLLLPSRCPAGEATHGLANSFNCLKQRPHRNRSPKSK